MICVTGGERTSEVLARRIEDHRHLSLQEVRLDLLQSVDDDALHLLRNPNLVVTCRGPAEGGGFKGGAEERHAILWRALEQQPGYLDVELSTPQEVREELFRRRRATRLICSFHAGDGHEWTAEVANMLAESPADLLKVVIPVGEVQDLGRLLELLPGERRPVIRIGSGAAGQLSRALYRKFESPWTYVVPTGADAVAPGQLGLDHAELMRVGAENLTPLALIGGQQVTASPGPRVYNRLFAAADLPYTYLPVVTTRPEQALTLLERLGFAGCSVTMPAKVTMMDRLDRVVPPADRVGAVNTILLQGGHRIGLNTDVDAVEALVRDAGLTGATALVLGGGGAARAALTALEGLGCRAAVACRDTSRAEALIAEIGGRVVPWHARGEASSTILINATPCGADGSSLPVPDQTPWEGRLVIDAVLSERPTPLVERARARGARAVGGREWWYRQGMAQMAHLVGRRFTRAELLEVDHA